ncbi:hypothetical protein Tsubulata_027803 [Turnera subulata]|uniref:ubiquitinyl hydrolase 1 n=1 Tax=Turnera subulata TaxID=218843 RepID=A0A9Q0G9T0_9ROSI|nr:hypothetical protein Tsubulata_027803 [Turnera subulata]
MLVHEPDPDVVRWGLHYLIDVLPLSHSGSCNNSITQYGIDTSEVGYVGEYYAAPVHSNNVENDAVIARALQEELSQIAADEASGVNNPGKELVIAQDWLGSHGRHHPSGHEYNQRVESGKNKINADACSNKEAAESSEIKSGDIDQIPMAISSPGNGEKLLELDELTLSFDLSDEESLNGEVGKRFNEMVPVPHVPKVNGELPSEDEEISDHQRLLDRLKLYDLVENKVQGDGNCQFRSLSDQLYCSSDHHKYVRERVLDQLKSQPHLYEGYVPMAYGDYLKKMSKSGEWGDHVTLQAAADSYGVRIFVMTSFKNTCYIEILPQVQKTEREVHYNSIYPEADLALHETKKKKKWWKR